MSFPANDITVVSDAYDHVGLAQHARSAPHEDGSSNKVQAVQKPIEWPLWLKWLIVALVAAMNMLEYIQCRRFLFFTHVY